MSNQSKFRGTGVALVTPFNETGEIDYASFAKVINHVIEGGVEYVVALGTTGETPSLSREEKDRIIRHTVDTVKGRVPVVVGAGSNNTKDVIDCFKNSDWNGVDAILSVSPYYNKPNQRGIYAHYKTVAEHSPLPVILYNVPGRTSSNVLPETTLQLARDCKNIMAVKEASGNMDQIMQVIKNKPKDFLVISGDDLITLPIIASGGNGVISVIANALPKDFSEMTRMALAGDFEKARSLHYKIDDFTRLIFADGNPGGVKCLMSQLGLIAEEVRLPLVKVSESIKAGIEKELKGYQA